MYDVNESGKRLANMRKRLGKTQEQVAEDLGIAVGSLSKIERGERGCSIDMLDLFKTYYDVSADEILYGCEIKKDVIMELVCDLPVDKQEIAVNLIKSVLINLS